MTKTAELNFRNSSLEAFEGVMEEHLPGGLAESIAFHESMNDGQKPYVLNFLGGPRIIEELSVPGASLNIEIIDPISEVPQLIWDVKTPDSLDQVLGGFCRDRHIPGFDLIVARPVSQDKLVDQDRNSVRYALYVLIDKLNTQGKLIYHGIPGKIASDQIILILEDIKNNNHYVQIDQRDNEVTGFLITKNHPNSSR